MQLSKNLLTYIRSAIKLGRWNNEAACIFCDNQETSLRQIQTTAIMGTNMKIASRRH